MLPKPHHLLPILPAILLALATLLPVSVVNADPKRNAKPPAVAPSRTPSLEVADEGGKFIGHLLMLPSGYSAPFLLTTIDGVEVTLRLVPVEENFAEDGQVYRRRAWVPDHRYARYSTPDCTGDVLIDDDARSEETGARVTLLQNALDGTYVLHIAGPGPARWVHSGSLRDANSSDCFPNQEIVVARSAERSVQWSAMVLRPVPR